MYGLILHFQVNIMPTGRKKRKRSVTHTSAAAILSLIKVAVLIEQEKEISCRHARLCSSLNIGSRVEPLGAMENVLLRLGGFVV